jgi:hypothetical protein
MLHAEKQLNVAYEGQISAHAVDLNNANGVGHTSFDRELIVRAALRTIQECKNKSKKMLLLIPLVHSSPFRSVLGRNPF